MFLFLEPEESPRLPSENIVGSRTSPSNTLVISKTYHVHLLDSATLGKNDSMIKNAINLLDPRTVASKVVKDIPILADSATTLASAFGAQARTVYRGDMSVLVPPAPPARRIRR